MSTDPIDDNRTSTAARLAIAPVYKDPRTGATYIHQDLRLTQGPWDEEAHLSPIAECIRFGDVESWAAYIKRYSAHAQDWPSLTTWNAQGLRAVLDYHGTNGTPNRCKWQATYPFEGSREWRAWMALATGQPISQRSAIEHLEDMAEDIVEPAPTDLMALLRSLRAAVNATAQAELRPDGSTSVAFQQDKSIRGGTGGSVELPPEFTIAIPVLKGHVAEDGRPVVYKLGVRLRASVDDNARLALRFTIPTADRVLEAVYADRVATARQLLGSGYALLRAAD